MKGRPANKYPIGDVASDVTDELIEVWTSSVSQFSQILQDRHNIQEKVRKLLERSKNAKSEAAIEKLLMDSKELFEVLCCRYGLHNTVFGANF